MKYHKIYVQTYIQKMNINKILQNPCSDMCISQIYCGSQMFLMNSVTPACTL